MIVLGAKRPCLAYRPAEVRAYRRGRDVSQAELSRELGWHQSKISRYENYGTGLLTNAEQILTARSGTAILDAVDAIAARPRPPRSLVRPQAGKRTGPIHGLMSTYINHECRCDACRAANTAYEPGKEARARRREWFQSQGLTMRGTPRKMPWPQEAKLKPPKKPRVPALERPCLVKACPERRYVDPAGRVNARCYAHYQEQISAGLAERNRQRAERLAEGERQLAERKLAGRQLADQHAAALRKRFAPATYGSQRVWAAPSEFALIREAAGLTNAQMAEALRAAGMGSTLSRVTELTRSKGGSRELLARVASAVNNWVVSG